MVQEEKFEKKKEITSYIFDPAAWNSPFSGNSTILYVIF